MTFDDPVIREQALSDPRLFLETAGERIILDEIQYVPQLLPYVKMEIDAKRNQTGRYIFTGSQQFPLIKDLGDSLAGRIALLELLPFHMEEKGLIQRISKKMAQPTEAFVHACLTGSYPEPSLKP